MPLDDGIHKVMTLRKVARTDSHDGGSDASPGRPNMWSFSPSLMAKTYITAPPARVASVRRSPGCFFLEILTRVPAFEELGYEAPTTDEFGKDRNDAVHTGG